jgi:hypothetical protein
MPWLSLGPQTHRMGEGREELELVAQENPPPVWVSLQKEDQMC